MAVDIGVKVCIYGPSGLEKISQSTSLRSIQSNIGNWTIYENESL